MQKILFVLVLFLPSFFTLLLNKKGQLQSKKEKFIPEYHYYSKFVLDELNLYRKEKTFAEPIAWDDKLENTAVQEAFKLSFKRRSFGIHDNFQKWQKNYKGFAEISVNVYTSKLESKKIFAMGVLEALKEKYKYDIVQEFKKGGVGIYQDSKYKEKFIVVIHLAESGKPNEKNIVDLSKLRPPKPKKPEIAQYDSCKDAKQEGDESLVILGPDGKKMKCEQQIDGGGWSEVLDVKKTVKASPLVIPINDRGMSYSEVLFKARKDYYQSSEFKKKKAYDQNGFCFAYNTLKFGDKWYFDKRGDKYNVNQIRYNAKDVTKIIKPASLCYFNQKSRPELCASIFKFTKIPAQPLKAYSEIQSVAKKWYSNNLYQYDFQLFVR